jgi:hypothetical protein
VMAGTGSLTLPSCDPIARDGVRIPRHADRSRSGTCAMPSTMCIGPVRIGSAESTYSSQWQVGKTDHGTARKEVIDLCCSVDDTNTTD